MPKRQPRRKRRVRVTDVRRAGRHHAVLTLSGKGGDHSYCTKPCPTCPWRKDAVGIFPAAAFRHSAHTAYDMNQSTFACHSVGCDKPATCAGFLLNGSQHNFAVRVMLLKGEIDLAKVSDGGVALFDSYADMAIANGVRKNDPILRPCRGVNEQSVRPLKSPPMKSKGSTKVQPCKTIPIRG